MGNKLMMAGRLAVLLIAGALVAVPAHADKPAWAGGGKSHRDRDDRGGKSRDRDGGKHERDDRSRSDRSKHFDKHRRSVVHDYYAREHRRGRCPPGLSKKNNGCMPPGQAKKWHMGRPLPRDVVFHDLPPQLVVEIGLPPAGHRFVRVATDILLIAVGTGMVVDAIDDLGRM